jgi:hypothetical protein
MQMLTREQSKNMSSVTGQKEESGENQRVHTPEEEAQLTKNMNKATAKLNLLSENGEQDMEEDVEGDEDEFDDAMDREEERELDTSYLMLSTAVIYQICLSKSILIPTARKAKTSQRTTSASI